MLVRDLGWKGKGWGCCGGRKHEASEAGKVFWVFEGLD